MRRMKELLMITVLSVALAGCGGASGNAKDMEAVQNVEIENGQAEKLGENGQVENHDSGQEHGDNSAAGTGLEIESSESAWTEEEIMEEIYYLEKNFGYGLEFEDMDPELAESYGEDISEFYDFKGRMTEDGFGYVLGFKKGSEDPFEGYEQFWINSEFVIAERDENTYEETIIYSLDRIENIYQGIDNEILYLQVDDMEVPEEIMKAFTEKYGNGEEGRAYLQDVLNRGVRFAPPESGAYLAVYRYENGRQRLEYVPLSSEEEQRILESDALILPEWYGHYGLKFFVSQETYEAMGQEQGAITYEALQIAEERCRFRAMNISEIQDITKARMEIKLQADDGREEIAAVEITDEDLLKELEEIFSSAEATGEGKCPYRGILTLTRADGEELVLSLAIDSCDGFVYGSNGFYTAGKKETERIWEIFSELRKYTGWATPEEYEAK